MSTRMKIGVQTGFSGATPPDLIAEYGGIVEERGFYSLWVPEHVVFFRDHASRYPYSADGKIPGNPDGVMEPLTALTFVAANTERLRLGTGICLVPQRDPIYTAKQVADVDYLSKGRVDFGVGIGWLREDRRSSRLAAEPADDPLASLAASSARQWRAAADRRTPTV